MIDDISALMDKATEALRRDLNHIFAETSQGKLSAPAARDLVAYIKLLGDVLDKHAELQASLQSIPDQELNEALQRTDSSGTTTPKKSPVRVKRLPVP